MSTYQRKLATIQTITGIRPHLNADSLELIDIMGWQVVNKKGQFQVGDRVIYLEIDSVCPPRPEFAFLQKCKYRIKTIRLRQELSQGLVLSMSYLDEPMGSRNVRSINVGDDVTDILGITKYESPDEPQSQTQSTKTSTIPTHYGFSKTDEPRIQSHQKLLEKFQNQEWYATLKIDGTSSTYMLHPDNRNELIVCSRNLRVEQESTNLWSRIYQCVNNLLHCRWRHSTKTPDVYWQIAEKYDLKTRLQKYPNLVIQGEIYGPKILGNKLNTTELKLAIFSIFDLNIKEYVNFQQLNAYCSILGLDRVEVIDSGLSFNFTLPELLEKSKGYYPNTKNHREGLVYRLKHDTYASFKVINNDYLEQKGH